MNRRPFPPLALVILASLALGPPARSAPDEDASAGADAGAPIPRFDAEPFPEDKSPLPTVADWKPTTPVALTSSRVPGCRAYRVREWMKIRCTGMSGASLALLGGSREGVSFSFDPPKWQGGPPMGGEMVFPVRKGDARVFEWCIFGDSYEGVGAPEVAFLVSESWAPGDPEPVIIAH